MNRSRIVIAAAVLVVAAAVAVALAWPGASSGIYRVAPTVACLRAHGYSVPAPHAVKAGGKSSVTVEVEGTSKTKYPHDKEFLSFLPSEKDAAKAGIWVTRRNVVFNIYDVGSLPAAAGPVFDCLRS